MWATERTRTGLLTVTLCAVGVAAAATGLWQAVVPPEDAEPSSSGESAALPEWTRTEPAPILSSALAPDVDLEVALESAELAPAPPAPAPTGATVRTVDETNGEAIVVDVVHEQEEDEEDEDQDEAVERRVATTLPIAAPAPSTPQVDERVVSRGPTSPANQRARSIARRTALRHFAGYDAPATAVDDAPAAAATAEAPSAVAYDFSVPETATVAVGAAQAGSRSLLFVWDPSIAGDAVKTAELLQFASIHGYTALAMDATAVAYGDTAARDRYATFVDEARIHELETFALIGYPWFTVSAGAGLPGQPTSSDEGLAMIETLVATGLFDGVVEDSQPYGVEYASGGSVENWLFDQPDRAAEDLAAYLEAARVLLGDLELIKATPFWFDSDARLDDIRDAAGAPLGTMAHVVAGATDAAVVLAYRDSLDGPNGIIELASTEVTLGPTMVAVETADLGPAMDYLTYAEEGYDALSDDLVEVTSRFAGTLGFQGTAVHHYRPVLAMATEAERELFFGFLGTDRVRLSSTAVVDSYDSGLGSYSSQIGFDRELRRFVAGDEGTILTNRRVELTDRSLVHGDVKTSDMDELSVGNSATITGETVELERDVPLLPLAADRAASNQSLTVPSRQRQSLSGDQTFDRIDVDSGAQLTLVGPATVHVNRLEIDRGGSIRIDATAGAVDIVCSQSMQIREFGWIASNDTEPADVRIRYAGTSLRMRSLSALSADLVAPNAEVVVDSYAQVYGRVAARRLTLNGGSGAHLDMALIDVPAPR